MEDPLISSNNSQVPVSKPWSLWVSTSHESTRNYQYSKAQLNYMNMSCYILYVLYKAVMICICHTTIGIVIHTCTQVQYVSYCICQVRYDSWYFFVSINMLLRIPRKYILYIVVISVAIHFWYHNSNTIHHNTRVCCNNCSFYSIPLHNLLLLLININIYQCPGMGQISPGMLEAMYAFDCCCFR